MLHSSLPFSGKFVTLNVTHQTKNQKKQKQEQLSQSSIFSGFTNRNTVSILLCNLKQKDVIPVFIGCFFWGVGVGIQRF